MESTRFSELVDAFVARQIATHPDVWFGFIDGRFPDATFEERSEALTEAMRIIGNSEGNTLDRALDAARRLRESAATTAGG
jgi:hypothetical protein